MTRNISIAREPLIPNCITARYRSPAAAVMSADLSDGKAWTIRAGRRISRMIRSNGLWERTLRDWTRRRSNRSVSLLVLSLTFVAVEVHCAALPRRPGVELGLPLIPRLEAGIEAKQTEPQSPPDSKVLEKVALPSLSALCPSAIPGTERITHPACLSLPPAFIALRTGSRRSSLRSIVLHCANARSRRPAGPWATPRSNCTQIHGRWFRIRASPISITLPILGVSFFLVVVSCLWTLVVAQLHFNRIGTTASENMLKLSNIIFMDSYTSWQLLIHDGYLMISTRIHRQCFCRQQRIPQM